LSKKIKIIHGEKCLEYPLKRIRSIADYQYGAGVGEKLFPDNVEIQYSPATGRIRYINLNGKRIATLRPTDGMLSLSISSAFTIKENMPWAQCFVTIKNDVAKFVAEGGDVFAAHVVKVDDDIRAKDEVIVLNEGGQVLAVGRTLLSGTEMKAFKTGVAVKVRHGSGKES
jgi:uncharacterized protein with predicted RNA binding PUA domain